MGKPTIYINFGIINNFNCIKLKVKVVISWTVYEICSLFFNDIIQNEKFHKIYLITISKQRASAMKPYLALFYAPFFFGSYSAIQNLYKMGIILMLFHMRSEKSHERDLSKCFKDKKCQHYGIIKLQLIELF